MPRYHFHFSDGKHHFTDDTGRELAGIAAARAYAVRHVRELKAALCDPEIKDLSGWTMTVVDAKGRAVFAIGFDLAPAPARVPEPLGSLGRAGA